MTTFNRRLFIQTSAALTASALIIRPALAAVPIRIGVFVPLSGGAALFGPSARAAARVAANRINAEGGILGRPVELVIADGGVAPAEAAKSALRMTLSNTVDLIVGSHDSAVRQAIENTIESRVPYIYTPVFEGQDCAPHTYFLGETPEQQISASIQSLVDRSGGTTFYLIGNDYVWPRVTNEAVKVAVANLGGEIVGEEYYPVGAANKFESSIQKIRNASPAIVLQTLVGGDNVNFNRTFGNFGLSADILRMSCLLEENTLLGIGASASENLYSCMSYFANLDTLENAAYLEAVHALPEDGDAVQNTIGKSIYDGVMMARAVVEKAGTTEPEAFDAAVEGTKFETPSGTMTMQSRHTAKTMYLAQANGTEFEVVETYQDVPTAQTCS